MSPGRDPATSPGTTERETGVGSVFVSNYPPYSAWGAGGLEAVERVLDAPGDPATPLGLYMHVPFCRRRCKFCYFKVYTDKNAGEVQRYLAALASEIEALARRPVADGRPLKFVYFGGGTPSFISAKHLRALVARVRGALSWADVDEVTFECEPGTLTEAKLAAIREIGVTRLSLGVENFDDAILRENGRAHVSKEIDRCLPWIRALDFPQLNVDLIAGMVGETWDSWRETVRRTVELAPESVTIYQMELPYNTIYSKSLIEGGEGPGVADWALKRAWHEHAIDELAAAGYDVSSAYTMVRRDSGARFVYRDSLWRGADLLGTGVASFSHVGGVHFQNVSGWTPYLERLEAGGSAVERALEPTADERRTRELVLQLKLGAIRAAYFRDKFGVDVIGEHREALDRLAADGMLEFDDGGIRLTRRGLLQADALLPHFYDARYRGARYT